MVVTTGRGYHQPLVVETRDTAQLPTEYGVAPPKTDPAPNVSDVGVANRLKKNNLFLMHLEDFPVGDFVA